jgi:hypothetical protein
VTSCPDLVNESGVVIWGVYCQQEIAGGSK